LVDNRPPVHKNVENTSKNASLWETRVKTHAIRRMMVAGLLALVGTLLFPSMATAQDAPESCEVDIADYEGTAIIEISPLTVAPGGTVTISGSGFPPNVIVPLLFNGEQFASPVTDETGAFAVQFVVPADIGAGVVTFEVVCGAFTLSANLNVAVGSVPPGQLPGTGSDSTLPLIQLSIALLAGGALLLFLARRQSRRREIRETIGV
jgi:LPXTG-motif cell wall-anchored protein